MTGLAVAAAAVAFGLYVARTAPALLYARVPALLEGAAALALGLAAALSVVALWMVVRLAIARPGAHAAASAAILLPLVALSVVLLRPFPDLPWAGIVLAAVAAGALLAVWQVLSVTPAPEATRADRRGAPAQPNGEKQRLGWWRAVIDRQAAPLLAGVITFVVYLRTMAPSVVAGDSAELQTVGYTLGIAHPTGYPLFVLLAKLFTFLPFGTVAYRVNLVSAVFGAATVYVLVRTARGLSGDDGAAIVAGLTLAFGAVFWSQAVAAEVYTLNAFFIALMIYLMARDEEGAPERREGQRPPYALWLTFGFSLTHHRTAALLAPALVTYAVLAHRRMRPASARTFLATMGLVSLPLTAYLYLPLRWPAVNGGSLDWEQFRWYVLGSGYSFALRLEALWAEVGRYGFFLNLLRDQVTIPGLLLATLGVLALLVRRPRSALLTLLSGGAFALFPIAYHVPDAAVFSIPLAIVFALWLAVGLAALMSWVDRLTVRRMHLAGGAGLCLALAALLPGALLAANFATNDASRDWVLDRWGRTALAQRVPLGAIVVADMWRLSALRYFYGVEAPERGVAVVMPDTEAVANQIIGDSLNAGRPAYLARYLPGLERKYRLNAAGPLVEVTTGTPATPPPAVARRETLPVGVTLLGFTPGPPEEAAGETWPITLYWRVEQNRGDSFYVHLRLRDDKGGVAHAAKPGVPVQGLYPTWAWPGGEVVADYRELSLPRDMAPAPYDIAVGLGGAFRAPEQWVALGRLQVLPPLAEVPTRPALAVFDRHLALVGYDWQGANRPGGTVKVALRWQALASEVEAGTQVHLDLVDAGGAPAAAIGRPLRWRGQEGGSDDTWTQVVALPLPAAIAPGTYRLRVRLDSAGGRPWPALSGWPGRRDAAVSLTELVVTRPLGALTNLENKAILVRHVLESDALRPGDALRMTLYWRAAAKLDLDYTVFVHLLDGGQRVRAQVDSFPAGGLRPTSQWRLDELVEDAYQIPIPADLPAGNYELEVGMYLAANMQRLQVLDAEDHPVDDRVLLGGVRVRGE